jgi:hypothetical protein
MSEVPALSRSSGSAASHESGIKERLEGDEGEIKNVRTTDAKEVGVGNPSEETSAVRTRPTYIEPPETQQDLQNKWKGS